MQLYFHNFICCFHVIPLRIGNRLPSPAELLIAFPLQESAGPPKDSPLLLLIALDPYDVSYGTPHRMGYRV